MYTQVYLILFVVQVLFLISDIQEGSKKRDREREEGGREMAKKAEEMSACLNTYHDSFIVADYHKRASLAVIAQACRC